MQSDKKLLTILGSTGSIGQSTLRVARMLSGEVRVYGLGCNRNLELLAEQIEEFKPSVVAVSSWDARGSVEFRDLASKYPSVEFIEGDECMVELAGRPVDIVLSSIVGAAGLRPSLAALESCRRLALANKETLVMAGDIFMAEVARRGVELIPVDSEHSAIFSLLHNVKKGELERILLTASGGSLRDLPVEELPKVTPAQALAHPTWNMGNKITIDSATLMNKGLEVIEAHHLFDTAYEKIDVVVHPESVVHSMIETVDGAVYAHMGVADMALPILNAMKYPEKVRNNFGRLDFTKSNTLRFLPWDSSRYPALTLCYEAGKRGGTLPAVLNAANEVAVDAFLKGKIFFTDIVRIVEKVMEGYQVIGDPGIEDIFEADRIAREIALINVRGMNK